MAMPKINDCLTRLVNAGVLISNKAKIQELLGSAERPFKTLMVVASQGRPHRMGFYAHPVGVDHASVREALSLLDQAITEEDLMMFTANIYDVLPYEPIDDTSGIFA